MSSASGEKKKRNPGPFVTQTECALHVQRMREDIKKVESITYDVKEALVGKLPEGGGMLSRLKSLEEAVKGIKKSSLSGRDKATIVAAVIMAIASIVIALVK